ncbi:MAG: BON domain-containing protein [Candidatus Eutrophobiaceae bacterium]
MKNPILALLLLLPILQGCAAIGLGGALAAGANASIDRRTTGTLIDDELIELKALKEYSSDKDIREQTHINITSYNGIVLMSGEAPNQAILNKVMNILRDIPKIKHIHNEISISAPSSLISRASDSGITAKIKSLLLIEEKLSALNIKVVTENGTVFLMGIITNEEADLATDITRRASGVQKVVRLFEIIQQ